MYIVTRTIKKSHINQVVIYQKHCRNDVYNMVCFNVVKVTDNSSVFRRVNKYYGNRCVAEFFVFILFHIHSQCIRQRINNVSIGINGSSFRHKIWESYGNFAVINLFDAYVQNLDNPRHIVTFINISLFYNCRSDFVYKPFHRLCKGNIAFSEIHFICQIIKPQCKSFILVKFFQYFAKSCILHSITPNFIAFDISIIINPAK